MSVGSAGDLNDVGSIGSGSSFSGISLRVLVTTNPLEVNVVILVDFEVSGDKVVLGGGVGLDDVSSLSSDIQVVDSSLVWDGIGSLLDEEDVRSILEGSAKLSGIHGESDGLSVLLDNGVFENRGFLTVEFRIGESSLERVVKIGGGDVVSHSKHASIGIGINGRDGPVVAGGVSDGGSCISEMVLSGPRSLHAIGSSLSVSLHCDPFVSSSFAGSLLVLGGGAAIILSAFVSILDILGLLLVKVAICGGGGKDSNIDPRGWMPVRIVVSLLSALQSVSISIVVLSGEDGSSSALVEISFLLSISNEKSEVSVSGSAGLVMSERLVHSESVLIASGGSDRGFGGVDSVSGGSVSDVIISIGGLVGSTHVLDNQVAVHSRITATVLVGPFDGEERTFVKIHFRTLAVTTLGVVLRVKQSVGIISIGIVFSQPIVGTSEALHVKIAEATGHAQ
jgi:hypothetical protein